jgi:hypothetical protein
MIRNYVKAESIQFFDEALKAAYEAEQSSRVAPPTKARHTQPPHLPAFVDYWLAKPSGRPKKVVSGGLSAPATREPLMGSADFLVVDDNHLIGINTSSDEIDVVYIYASIFVDRPHGDANVSSDLLPHGDPLPTALALKNMCQRRRPQLHLYTDARALEHRA